MLPRRLISSTWLGSRRLWPEPWWPYPSPAAFGINNDDGDGKMEISCNGEGALFVVAQADDLTADDVKKFKPPPELRRLFVPLVEPSSIMLAVQVY
jgi:shikimate O-hydroxycinnamoyltransferase